MAVDRIGCTVVLGRGVVASGVQPGSKWGIVSAYIHSDFLGDGLHNHRAH